MRTYAKIVPLLVLSTTACLTACGSDNTTASPQPATTAASSYAPSTEAPRSLTPLSMLSGEGVTVVYYSDSKHLDKERQPLSVFFLQGGKVAEGNPGKTYGELSKMSDEAIFAAAQADPNFVPYSPAKVTMETDSTGNMPKREDIIVTPSKKGGYSKIGFTSAVTSTVFYESSYLVAADPDGWHSNLLRVSKDSSVPFMVDSPTTPGVEVDPKS